MILGFLILVILFLLLWQSRQHAAGTRVLGYVLELEFELELELF